MTTIIQKLTTAFKTYVLRDSQLLEVRRWLKNKGDVTLRLDYPLGKDSVVFDLGGYHGDFAASMIERYDCHVYIFEPVPIFSQICTQRFVGNPKIRSQPFGLSSSNGEFRISVAADGSSIVRRGQATESLLVQVRSFADFIEQEGVQRIHLMKINIEGGEYDVLPHLFEHGLIERIANLQIQFHDFVPGHAAKRDAIRERLARTHTESWCYPFVWESWRIKDVQARR